MRTIHVPNRFMNAIFIPTIRVKMLHIVIALKNVTLVCNVISVPVEVLTFTMVMADNFGKYELITG